MTETESRRFVTLAQLLAERPWLTERHARRLVAERRIPFYKPAGKLLFDLDEIDAWTEQARVQAAS